MVAEMYEWLKPTHCTWLGLSIGLSFPSPFSISFGMICITSGVLAPSHHEGEREQRCGQCVGELHR